MKENQTDSNVKILSEQSINNSKQLKNHLFEKISYWSLLVLIFLLPIFFIPSVFSSVEFSKVLLVVFCALISLTFWSLARLSDGNIKFAGTLVFPAILFVVCVYFISSVFSDNPIISIIGNGFELSVFSLVCVGFILMFLVSSLFRTRDKIFFSYIALLVSFLVVFLFQGLRLVFGPSFLSFGIFNDSTSNIIGKWNDIGIYFGLIALLSVTTLEIAKFNKLLKIFLYFASMCSLFFIIIINFKTVWYIIGAFSLMFFLYFLFANGITKKQQSDAVMSPQIKKVPYFVLFFLAISVVFIVDGLRSSHIVSNSIARYFNISQIEITPSIQGTFDVFKQSLKENPILGSGPNNFVKDWLLFKPDGVNNTIFWNADFNYGAGSIPTFITTTGLLGLISWIVFIALFFYTGLRFVFIKIADPFSKYLIVSSFLASCYLWLVNIFYVPSATLFFLTFFFSGLFIAVLLSEKLITVKNFTYLGNPRRSLITVVVLVLITISSVTGCYIYLQKYFSSIYYQKAIASIAVNGNFPDAENHILKGLKFSKSDLHYRLLLEIYFNRLNLLSAQKNKISNEEFTKQLESIFRNMSIGVRSTIEYDNKNYLNYFIAGRLYEYLIPIEGAYNLSSDYYQEALKLNPKSPLINMALGRLEFTNKNNIKAKEYLIKAIQLKNNYTDAAFLLAQIEVVDGNIKNAIKLVEATSTLIPDNPVAFFQLGILKYSEKEKDYKGASEAFEKAVALNTAYSNARYFLGLSYFNLGKREAAIEQFQIVQSYNPDNKEVALILKNLKEGRSPFTNALPPIDNKPENRKNLPLKEDSGGEVKAKKK